MKFSSILCSKIIPKTFFKNYANDNMKVNRFKKDSSC